MFYKGFTRAFLQGETSSSTEMLDEIVKAVEEIGGTKKFVIVDGVGYPSVGSICGICSILVEYLFKDFTHTLIPHLLYFMNFSW